MIKHRGVIKSRPFFHGTYFSGHALGRFDERSRGDADREARADGAQLGHHILGAVLGPDHDLVPRLELPPTNPAASPSDKKREGVRSLLLFFADLADKGNKGAATRHHHHAGTVNYSHRKETSLM